MSSTMPSAKYSCSGSPLMLANGSTAIEGRSGRGGTSATSPDSATRSAKDAAVDERLAQLERQRLREGHPAPHRARSSVAWLGPRSASAHPPCAPRLPMLGLASTMRVFAQVVDRNCPASGCKRQIVHPRFALELAQPDHGIESKTFQPPLLPSDPFGPGRLRHGQIGKEWAFVEIGNGGEQIAATLRIRASSRATSQSMAPGARDTSSSSLVKHVLAQRSAQPEQGLAEVLPCLRIEMRAPKQGCQLLSRLRLGGGAGQVREQAGELLAGQLDASGLARQLEAAQQRKPAISRGTPFFMLAHQIIRTSPSWQDVLHFSRTHHKFNTPVTRLSG